MSAKKVIEIARGELGSTESPPGSNRTKYGEAFGWDGVPWCVIFLWWCFREAGESAAFFGGGKTASCGTLLRWYQAQGQRIDMQKAEAGDVLPGDIVILDFTGKGETQHCGIVEAAFTSSGKLATVRTIEGNTTPGSEGSQYNGGCVAEKWREPRQIFAVCRPTYKEEEKPVNDWEKHWARQHIQWAVDEGIAQGYQDGSFQPDKPVTRAELVTMLHRYDALRSRRDADQE